MSGVFEHWSEGHCSPCLARILLVAVITLTASACATYAPITKLLEEPGTPRTVRDTNYRIGESRTVSVGEVMVRVRFATQRAKPLGYADATESFAFASALETIHVERDKHYAVAGTTQLDGRTYHIVVVPAMLGQSLGLLVEQDGTISETVLNMGPTSAGGWAAIGLGGVMTKGIVIRLKYHATPASARVIPAMEWVPSTATTLDADHNVDLLYYGSTKDVLNIVARDYAPDDPIKPLHSQSISYDRTESTIRFRDLRIRIDGATSSSLTYAVVDDAASEVR